ncbi:MAG: nicotinate-nucleotide adenylyltransferase [Bacteroidia bacterium]|nr:nicotinate-nucleotide adenylyltransferase [Bacteroidia bacterium]
MKIGLYFGTFNPIHIGHMAIAGYMLSFGGLDKVWFIVTPRNPLKKKDSLLPEVQRLRMVREAIGDDTRFKASDVEFKLSQPNYTIHTLTYLQEQFPKEEFLLILGSDNLEGFLKWKNAGRILEKHQLLVYPRPGHEGGALKDHPRVKLLPAPLMDISSTFIRGAIAAGKDVKHFLPEAVWKYIGEMGFFRP